MKIAICVNAIQARDGTSQFALQLGQMFAKGGHEVTMLASAIRTSDLVKENHQLNCVSIEQGKGESKAKHVQRMGAIFNKHRYDVVFVCAGLPVYNLEHAMRLIPDPTCVVPIVGGDRDHVYQPMINTLGLWNMAVAESPRLKQQISLRMPNVPVKLLITGITHPSPAELVTRAAHELPLRIIYVGRLFGRKNVWMLPKILAACRDRGIPTTLSICGQGPDRASVEQSCHDEGVAEWVSFPEISSNSDLYKAYRDHHISLLTSDYGEGLGLVLLEAQANGCVPVASRLLGVTDFAIAENESGLLSEFGNPEDFAEKIHSLINPVRWRRLSARAIERTQRRFSFKEMTVEYEELLHELVSGQYPLPQSRSQHPSTELGFKDHIPSGAYRGAARLKNALNKWRQVLL
jgi:glycosyltransferase involved in cell wall biosynthesis